MKKTYKQITEFWSEAAQYLAQGKDDKLSSAISLMIGNPLKQRRGILSDVMDKVKEDKLKISLKFCSVDNQKNILRDNNKDLVFTSENFILCNESIKKLAEKDYDFDPILIAEEDLPDNLDEYQKKVFKGFIIE